MTMLSEINSQAGAVDIGSESLHVAVYDGPTAVFGTFTHQLDQMVEFFRRHRVKTVAMEATGVYWLVPFEVLQAAGLEVCVVNGAHVKNLPGRKSDLSDCQWLAQLHAHGLLRGGFVPPAGIRQLRDYQRLRQDHIEMGAAHVLHLQKALDRMNLKIHEVLSQITGVSGLRLVRAILGGERDPERLVELCDEQVLCKKRQRIIEALRGCYTDEQLFALRQALQGWEFYQKQIAACDRRIGAVLQQLLRRLPAREPTGPTGAPSAEAVPARPAKKVHHNAPQIPQLSEQLTRLCGGHDASRLPTLTAYSVLQIVAEVGTDLSRWPTHKHFTAWLGLAPGSRQSGKRRGSVKRFRGRAGRLFCVAARSLARSKHLALGGFYRRVRAVRGGQVANIAGARKVAELFYWTLRHGLDYTEHGLQAYEQKYRQQSIRRLAAAAQKFGFQLSAAPAAGTSPAMPLP